jgi:hypothetical protein
MLPNKSPGVPRVDDHRILNGIFWNLHLGAAAKVGAQRNSNLHLLPTILRLPRSANGDL